MPTFLSPAVALSVDPTSALQAATKQYVDNSSLSGTAATIASATLLGYTFGSAISSFNITTVTPGDVVLLVTAVSSNTVTATGVSGGNCTNWTRVIAPVNDATVVVNVDMWMGTVTAGGTAAVTITYSAALTGLTTYYDVKSFTAKLGPGTVWAVDGTQAVGTDNASSTSLVYPSLTASGAGRLYYGLIWSGSTSGVAGSTAGFTYALDNIARVAAWNTSVSGTVSPTASQTSAQRYVALGVLLTASIGLKAPVVSPTLTGTTSVAALNASGAVALNGATTTNALTVNGKATFNDAVVTTPVSLTDASTVAVDASLGNHFRLTLTATGHTMGNPSNPTDGQKILFEITSGGAFTFSWGTAYVWGSDIPVPTLSQTSGLVDYVGFVYNAAAGEWRGLAVARGY